MRVLIIPEDFRKDQYLVKPVIQKMFTALGRDRAKVEVCLDPNVGGVGEALKWEVIADIIGMYPMVQVFLLLIDRDCDHLRRGKLDSHEQRSLAILQDSRVFFAELAWQELEVWGLAGLDKLPREWVWKDIRNECHPKERYFDKVAHARGVSDAPGQGRSILGRESASNYNRLRSRCPEDVGQLESRLKTWLRDTGVL